MVVMRESREKGGTGRRKEKEKERKKSVKTVPKKRNQKNNIIISVKLQLTAECSAVVV